MSVAYANGANASGSVHVTRTQIKSVQPVAGVDTADAMILPRPRAGRHARPEPPVDNATATCTGTTTNQSGTNGYGTTVLSNNTITVLPGASVTGTDNGVVFVTSSVANFGNVSGTSNNGIFVVGTGDVTNSGAISGGNIGASITNGALTNANTGTITSGNIGVFFQDSGLLAGTPASVANAGAITGNQFGIQFKEQNHSTGGVVSNSGTISAMGVNGIGISARTTATVNNEVAGIISAPQFGIDATTANVDNAGRIRIQPAQQVPPSTPIPPISPKIRE